MTTLDEPSEPTAADEYAVADDRPAPHEHAANRADCLEPFVRGVVAGVMQVDGADRPSRGRIEQDEVGVTSWLDRSLPLEPE